MYAIKKNGSGFRAIDDAGEVDQASEDLYEGEGTPPANHKWLGGQWVLAVDRVKAGILPELRGRRDTALNVLDGLQGDALASGDTDTALAIKAAKQRCRDLPALSTAAATSEDALRAIYLAEWRAIAALVPAPVRAAFVAVLA